MNLSTKIRMNLYLYERKALQNLKRQFRRWYAALSVDELVTNRRLTARIDRIERMFQTALG